jgi:hypothetical protein
LLLTLLCSGSEEKEMLPPPISSLSSLRLSSLVSVVEQTHERGGNKPNKRHNTLARSIQDDARPPGMFRCLLGADLNRIFIWYFSSTFSAFVLFYFFIGNVRAVLFEKRKRESNGLTGTTADWQTKALTLIQAKIMASCPLEAHKSKYISRSLSDDYCLHIFPVYPLESLTWICDGNLVSFGVWNP